MGILQKKFMKRMDDFLTSAFEDDGRQVPDFIKYGGGEIKGDSYHFVTNLCKENDTNPAAENLVSIEIDDEMNVTIKSKMNTFNKIPSGKYFGRYFHSGVVAREFKVKNIAVREHFNAFLKLFLDLTHPQKISVRKFTTGLNTEFEASKNAFERKYSVHFDLSNPGFYTDSVKRKTLPKCVELTKTSTRIVFPASVNSQNPFLGGDERCQPSSVLIATDGNSFDVGLLLSNGGFASLNFGMSSHLFDKWRRNSGFETFDKELTGCGFERTVSLIDVSPMDSKMYLGNVVYHKEGQPVIQTDIFVNSDQILNCVSLRDSLNDIPFPTTLDRVESIIIENTMEEETIEKYNNVMRFMR